LHPRISTLFPYTTLFRSQILNWHADAVLTFGAPKGLMKTHSWRRGFAALGRRGLSFDLQLYPHQMDEAAELVRDHPDIPIAQPRDRKSTRLNSSHVKISY